MNATYPQSRKGLVTTPPPPTSGVRGPGTPLPTRDKVLGRRVSFPPHRWHLLCMLKQQQGLKGEGARA